MKYIMLKQTRGKVNYYYPIIFPNSLAHDDVADAMKKVIKGTEVHSAGEVSCFDAGEAHGQSSTLKKFADDNDTYRIRYADYGGLIE